MQLNDIIKTDRELTEACARSINLPPEYKWQYQTPLTSISDAMTVAAYHRMRLRYTNEAAYAGADVVPYVRYETHFMRLAMCRAITIASGHTTKVGIVCEYRLANKQEKS